jgi:hypothetical protein
MNKRVVGTGERDHWQDVDSVENVYREVLRQIP